jgi:hypothetical protein
MAGSTRPHAVLDPVNFPKIRAGDVSPVERSAFTEFYPNGLPNVYRTISDPKSSAAPRDYLEDHLPTGFYINPPAGAKAIFSTMEGKRNFRHMKHILPRRRVHLWTKDEIQSACNSIRQIFHHHMKGLLQPYCWDDLWTYFDAHDLYHYGILNLWNIINQLYYENQIIYADVMKEFALQAGNWVDTWLVDPKNRSKLYQWNSTDGMILHVFEKQDVKALGDVPDDVLPLLASALKVRRDSLTSRRTGQRKPSDLMSACRTESLENWLGKFVLLSYFRINSLTSVAGQPKFGPTGLPPAPMPGRQQPVSEQHSQKAHHFIHKGNHYYKPPHQNRPKRGKSNSNASTSAASTGSSSGPADNRIVIAVGTSYHGLTPNTPNAWYDRQSSGYRMPIHSAQVARAEAPSIQSPGKGLIRARSKSTPAPIAERIWEQNSSSAVDDTGMTMPTTSKQTEQSSESESSDQPDDRQVSDSGCSPKPSAAEECPA